MPRLPKAVIAGDLPGHTRFMAAFPLQPLMSKGRGHHGKPSAAVPELCGAARTSLIAAIAYRVFAIVGRKLR